MFGRIVVAALASIVSAVLLSVIASLVVGGGTSGAQFGLWVALVGYFLFAVLWVRGAPSARVTFRRSLLTVAVESFSLPLVGMIFTAGFVGQNGQTGYQTAGALIGGGIATTVLGCVGFSLGIFCLVLYLALRAEPQGRKATV